MKKLMVIILFLPVAAYSQVTLEFSPNSVQVWGEMPSAEMVRFTYNFPITHYLNGQVGFIYLYHRAEGKTPSKASSSSAPVIGSATGIFASPLSYKWKLGIFVIDFSSGVVLFLKDIPNIDGTKLNVLFELSMGLPVTDKFIVGLSYTHISNAFRGRINPGYDFPSLLISYNFK